MGAVKKTLPPAEAFVAGLRARMPRHARTAFLAACILGLAVHFYVFTNLLPNHDSVLSLFSTGSLIWFGRWFLGVLGAVGSNFMLPWLNGVLGIFCLAAASGFVVVLLDIRRPVFAVLVAFALVSFPVLSNTAAYMFTFDAYAMALLLSVIAAYITDRYKWGFCLSAPLLMLATASYQACLLFALALLACRGLLLLLRGECSGKELALLALRYATALGGGLVLYLVSTKLVLAATGARITGEHGISAMGSFKLSALPTLLAEAYRSYFRFFFADARDRSTLFMPLAHAGIFLGTLLLFALLFIRNGKKHGALQSVCAAALLLLMPLIQNAIVVAVSGSAHLLMQYPLVFSYLLPLALCEAYCDLPPAVHTGKEHPITRSLPALASWCAAGLLLFCSFSWSVYANKLYLELQLKYENSFALLNRVVDRVEQDEGYTVGMPVLFVGNFATGNYDATKADAYFSLGNSVGTASVYDYTLLCDDEHIKYFSKYFLGVQFEPVEMDPGTAEAFEDDPRVERMPSYPYEGCIEKVDGVLIVKIFG